MIFGPVMTIIGWSLTLLSALMLFPCLFALDRSSTDIAASFFISAIVTLFFGGALIFASRGEATALNRRNTFMIATFIWIVIPAFAALPFYLAGVAPSLLDAFFEALSGFTTNGASVMEGLDDLPRSIILWRALIQWFGGFSLIIVISMLATAISIPGSSPLNRALARSTRRRLSRRVRDAVLSTLSVYAILTGLCIVMLWFSGLSAFDALCYGFSTLSTGGFLVSDNGFELFENRLTELVLIIFMFAGAVNFALHWAFFNGNRRAYFDNPEYRYLIYVFLGLVCGLMAMLSLETHFGFSQALRYSIFNAMSFLTTTGYVMSPLTESGEIFWPVGTLMLLFVALTIGGSTGSTSGGLKLMRVAILLKLVTAEVRNLSFPSAVTVLKYSKEKITKDHILATWAFFTFYVFTILIVALGLSFAGMSLKGALAMASANLANAGSAIDFFMIGGGEINGGIGSYSGLPDLAKVLLCFAMVIGRLEFFAILALFNPALWKR